MSELEDLVETFLERRTTDPGLTPEKFANEHTAAGPPLLAALKAVLGAEAMFREATLSRPEHIGPYRVVRELGRGGMGVVYEGERDGDRFAVKVLLHAPMHGPRGLERFRREASALHRIEHEGVVRVRDEGLVDGAPWLAMDLVRGRPLSELVGRTDPRRAALLVRELALAVQAIHESGVLHRDLKPSNVLLASEARPVVCDFGLVHTEDEGSLTSTGEMLGTPRYMAPEQVRGEPADTRTDVHALGLILFELACGRAVHEGKSREEILSGVLRGLPRRPRRVAAHVPRPLERIVLQAAAIDPARRYPTARALAEDLERFLAGAHVLARPPGIFAHGSRIVRAAPATSALVAGLVLAVAVSFFLLRGTGSVSRADLVLALDRATWAWIDGNERLARRNASIVRGLVHGDADVDSLLNCIETAPFDPLTNPPRLAGPAAAAGELALARHARIGGRLNDARSTLESALARAPASAALTVELAWVLSETGLKAEARRQLAHAIELDPENFLTHEALATWCFEHDELPAGIESAHAAARLAMSEGEPPTRLPRLLERARDHTELRRLLAERLASHPDDADTRFALGVSLDTDHELGAAAEQYTELVRRVPEHAFALTYLGYLQLGALGERCERCVEAYRIASHVPDRAAGIEHVVRALAIDAGRDEELLRTIVSISLDKGLREEIKNELRSLLDVRERSARTARLESALRRLE